MTRDETTARCARHISEKRSSENDKVQDENGDLQQGVWLSPSGEKLEQREKGGIP